MWQIITFYLKRKKKGFKSSQNIIIKVLKNAICCLADDFLFKHSNFSYLKKISILVLNYHRHIVQTIGFEYFLRLSF